MSFARNPYTGDGSTNQYAVPFPYIKKAHVKCTVNGVDAPFTWVNSGLIQITSTPALGDLIIVYRDTSSSARLVDYQVGTLDESTMDTDSTQAFYLNQEAIDRANLTIGPADGDTTWSAASKRITNVANGTGAQDAVTVSQLAAASIAPIATLPLGVSQGGTGATTAAAARAALGAAPSASPTFSGTVAVAAGGAITVGAGGTVTLGQSVPVTFEGATVDAFKTTLNAVDPTANRNINLPDKSGTVAVTTDITPQVAEKYILIEEQQNSGTDGGTSASGSWQTRPLNTIVSDASNVVVSLAAGVLTLPAGTYRFVASGVGYEVDSHKIRLRNTADGVTVGLGINAYAIAVYVGQSASVATGRFTIAANKTFQLQHWVQTTRASDGLGRATSTGEKEVYARLELFKEV